MQNQGMTYDYSRVSAATQELTTQRAQLDAAVCEKVFCKKITRTHADRPQLSKLAAVPQPGAVVITPTIDRISCDTTNLRVIERKIQSSGAGLCSLVERTAHGRAVANAPYVKFRRKPKLTLRHQSKAAARVVAREPQRAVARSYNVGQATISRLPPAETAYG